MGEVFKHPCNLAVFNPYIYPDTGMERVEIHWLEPHTVRGVTAYWQTAVLREIGSDRIFEYEIGAVWPEYADRYLPLDGSPYHWRGTTKWEWVGNQHPTAYECVLEARQDMQYVEKYGYRWINDPT